MGHPWLSVVMPVFNGANYLEQALLSIVFLSATMRSRSSSWMAARPTGPPRFSARSPVNCRCGCFGAVISRIGSPRRTTVSRKLEAIMCQSFIMTISGSMTALRPARTGRALSRRSDVPSSLMVHRPQRYANWAVALSFAPGRRRVRSSHRAAPRPELHRHARAFVLAEGRPALGGLEEGLWYTADWDFWLKLATPGPTIYHPRPLAAFRIHPRALTMQGSSQLDDFQRQLEVVLDRHLGGWEQSRGTNVKSGESHVFRSR